MSLPTARAGRSRRTQTPVVSTTGYIAARALLACGGALALAAAVSLLDGRRALGPLTLLAALSGLVGGHLRRRTALPFALRIPAVHAAVVAAWLLMIGVGTITYLACGTFERVDLALVESVAGFTTTAVSVLDPVEGNPKGLLFFRASTQWLGGFAAVAVVAAILPVLGVSDGRRGSGPSARRSVPLRSPRIAATVRRLAAGYLVLSGVGVVLFLVGGMGPFDAVTYAMTTISTGGFGNHDGSLAHFRSAALEWLTVGGMALGGTSLVLVLAIVRGRAGELRRSIELRAYAVALAVGSGLAVWWTAPPDGLTHESVRHAIFSVTSAASTTGHTVDGWAGWGSGMQVLLLLLAAVGAMSGAAGGGFRAVRALTLLDVVRREVVRQLHPRSVVVVKVGGRPVEEAVVSHTVGYQAAWVMLAGVGAVGLAVGGLGMHGAISGAVSALATFGPGLGELAPGATGGVPTAALLALLPLMLAGRLEISPLPIGTWTLLTRATGKRRRRSGVVP